MQALFLAKDLVPLKREELSVKDPRKALMSVEPYTQDQIVTTIMMYISAVCQESYVYSPLYFIQKPKIILCTKLNFHQVLRFSTKNKRLANLVPMKSLNEK